MLASPANRIQRSIATHPTVITVRGPIKSSPPSPSWTWERTQITHEGMMLQCSANGHGWVNFRCTSLSLAGYPFGPITALCLQIAVWKAHHRRQKRHYNNHHHYQHHQYYHYHYLATNKFYSRKGAVHKFAYWLAALSGALFMGGISIKNINKQYQ